MKVVFLDGARIGGMTDVFAAFDEAVGLPPGCGKNMDALHDVLTERTDEIGVIIVNIDELHLALGRRFNGFMRLMNDLTRERAEFYFSDDPFALSQTENP